MIKDIYKTQPRKNSSQTAEFLTPLCVRKAKATTVPGGNVATLPSGTAVDALMALVSAVCLIMCSIALLFDN